MAVAAIAAAYRKGALSPVEAVRAPLAGITPLGRQDQCDVHA
jgi:hypothetical protein